MDQLYLRIYLLGNLANLLEHADEATWPKGVTCDVLPVTLGDAPEVVPNDRDAVVVTDDLVVLAHFLCADFGLVNLVFVGDERELVEAFGHTPRAVVTVWPKELGDALASRMSRLANVLKDRYDLWRYHQLVGAIASAVPGEVWQVVDGDRTRIALADSGAALLDRDGVALGEVEYHDPYQGKHFS